MLDWTDWLDEEEFDAAMARFRCAPGHKPDEVMAALDAVKRLIRENCPEPDPPRDYDS